MRSARFVLTTLSLFVPAAATAGTISVTLPRLSIAEYKKPYVAGWVEPATGGNPRSLFVWYATKKDDAAAGTKWLSDLRSWWRKAGRTMKLPADGVTGPTRGPGSYTIPLPADLAAGKYILNVEAARENGGRELISVPFSVPATKGQATGKTELGSVTLAAK